MGVTILGRSIEPAPAAVAAEEKRLSALDANGKASAVRAAKQTVGLCIRTRLFPQRARIPAACLKAAATLLAAGVTHVAADDRDL
jgi:hypothetical protein